jgi:hypothetical protein
MPVVAAASLHPRGGDPKCGAGRHGTPYVRKQCIRRCGSRGRLSLPFEISTRTFEARAARSPTPAVVLLGPHPAGTGEGGKWCSDARICWGSRCKADCSFSGTDTQVRRTKTTSLASAPSVAGCQYRADRKVATCCSRRSRPSCCNHHRFSRVEVSQTQEGVSRGYL